ncbi:MAG: hypothetical protein AAFO91_00020 [Bacteroidota bacterium]
MQSIRFISITIRRGNHAPEGNRIHHIPGITRRALYRRRGGHQSLAIKRREQPALQRIIIQSIATLTLGARDRRVAHIVLVAVGNRVETVGFVQTPSFVRFALRAQDRGRRDFFVRFTGNDALHAIFFVVGRDFASAVGALEE